MVELLTAAQARQLMPPTRDAETLLTRIIESVQAAAQDGAERIIVQLNAHEIGLFDAISVPRSARPAMASPSSVTLTLLSAQAFDWRGRDGATTCYWRLFARSAHRPAGVDPGAAAPARVLSIWPDRSQDVARTS